MNLHEKHQLMLEEHKQSKVNRRELHKKTLGRKFRYPGNLY